MWGIRHNLTVVEAPVSGFQCAHCIVSRAGREQILQGECCEGEQRASSWSPPGCQGAVQVQVSPSPGIEEAGKREGRG